MQRDTSKYRQSGASTDIDRRTECFKRHEQIHGPTHLSKEEDGQTDRETGRKWFEKTWGETEDKTNGHDTKPCASLLNVPYP